MKRIYVIATILALILSCAGCQLKKKSVSLYEEAITISEKIGVLTKDEDYVMLFTGSNNLEDRISEIAEQDFTKPKAVYRITGINESTMMFMKEELNHILKEETEEIFKERFAASICNQINARNGADFMAATSILSVRDAFYNNELKDTEIFLCVYDEDYGTMTAFTPYDGGIVDASSTIVMMEGLSKAASEDEVKSIIQNIRGMSDIKVEKVEK